MEYGIWSMEASIWINLFHNVMDRKPDLNHKYDLDGTVRQRDILRSLADHNIQHLNVRKCHLRSAAPGLLDIRTHGDASLELIALSFFVFVLRQIDHLAYFGSASFESVALDVIRTL